MKRFLLFSVVFLSLVACKRQKESDGSVVFVNEVLNGYTPVKNQGHGETCWIFAMLSTIETEHIGRGDSVHLSPYYVIRRLLERDGVRSYFCRGRKRQSMRGIGMMLVNAIEEYGVVPYDAYWKGRETNVGLTAKKVWMVAGRAAGVGTGLDEAQQRIGSVLDDAFDPTLDKVYVYSAEYTPQEFAHSVCAPNEYMAITSFSHHPFYECFDLEVPDNSDHTLFMNLPIDTLMQCMEQAVRSGHGVCWEGDVSERGFSFARGIATLPNGTDTGQANRQREFEHLATTDDHCMAIVGIAHDQSGHKYFVMKNSWGTANPYSGLMYVSFDYVRLKTIAVFIPHSCIN